MKLAFLSASSRRGGCVSAFLLVILSALSFVAPAGAQDAGDPEIVLYTQAQVELQGIIPFSRNYTFTMKSPGHLTPGVSVPVSFAVSKVAIPPGVSEATAISYVTVSPANPTFTGPNQTQTFSVTYSVPANAVAGSYGMKILAQGFPVPTQGLINNGTTINAAVAPIGSNYTPPSISIANPGNGSTITIAANSLPISVPYSFSASSTGPQSSPITQLDVQLDLVTIPLGASTGVGTNSATGSGNLTITSLGSHLFTAFATNLAGQVSAISQFTVVVAPALAPPSVVITKPADGSTVTVTPGAFPVSIPLEVLTTSTVAGVSPITAVAASIDGSSVTLTSSGLGTTSVTSTGTLVINTPGQHTVAAVGINAGGTASDVNTFTVLVQAAPPTVVIHSPTVNSSYDYRIGSAATVVPFTFTATSSFGGIRTLTAKVDNANYVFTPSGLDTLTATGTINLPYTTGGTHTVSVTTTDDNGTATANSNFTVNVIAPTPTIVINQPTAGATFAIPTGSTTVSVPYSFVTTSNNGFVVNSVTATLDGNPITIGGTTGLGTASATSTGTLTGVSPGTHTLVATGVSSGITVSTSTTFTVTSVQPPPSVVINTPPVGSTYTRTSTGAAISIPLTFTGTSNATNGVITQLKATLNGSPVTVNSTTLNQKIANGSSTLVVSAAGTYTIGVTAVDAVGTASATRTFTVCVVQPRTICGSIFFDVDGDGNYDCEDFDITGVTVKLYNSSNAVIGTDVTDCSGDYSFCNIAPGTYRVVATAYAGLKASTVGERTVTVTNCNVTVARIGFRLDFVAMRTMTATGKDAAFWKFNLDKANSCNSSGAQISSSTLSSYTCKIGNTALAAYDNITMKQAASLMSTSAPSNNNCYTSYSSSSCYGGSYSYGSNCSSSNSTCSTWSPFSRELIASEYNYQRASYIGGNKNLTYMFIWWGEHVLLNPNKYGTNYTTFAKNWCAAYNNSNGGVVNGPLN